MAGAAHRWAWRRLWERRSTSRCSRPSLGCPSPSCCCASTRSRRSWPEPPHSLARKGRGRGRGGWGWPASPAVLGLVSRRGYRAVPTDQAMGTILTISAGIAVVLAVAGDGWSPVSLPLDSPHRPGLLLFGGVFAAAIPSFMFLAGIRWIGPVRAGVLMLIQPLVGVALAALFLQEAVGPVQAAGGPAVLTAAG